jgi:REP element-mobilizing transposase RayT
MLTSRVQQGLPFVCCPLMELILWSALGVAQSLYPVKILSFVVMGNHIHIIALVEDPATVESFMERFKCETAHAINRLLGRRQVTVWCEGYDSPVILTLDDLVEKLAYVYANPVQAHRAASIARYQGVSSWAMFTSGNLTREVKRIRRTFLGPVVTGNVSPAVSLLIRLQKPSHLA